jgi:lipid II:glycine glycyltransferase (peptidoglycan interpeptide bridge formation enzyme)
MENIKIEEELKVSLPILASKRYLSTKSNEFGWLVDDNFILPYFIDKNLIFERMVFTYSLIPKKENLNLEDEKKFLDNMVDFVKANRLCDFIYKAQSNVIFNTYPKDSDVVEWGTYVVDITKEPDEIKKAFHRNHKGGINKAIRENIKVELTNNIQEVYESIKETLLRQKSIHYPSLEYIQKLKENLGDNVCFWVAKKDGIVQGSLITIVDNEWSYNMYAGSAKRPIKGSTILMQYYAMLEMKKRGVKYFDFVGARVNVQKGSKFESLQIYKERFGAKLIKGYSFRTIINPIKYQLFNFVAKNYLKLKGFNYEDPIDNIKKAS